MSPEFWGERGRRRLAELEGKPDPLSAELYETLSAGLKLAERFDKVVAISDKFQSILDQSQPRAAMTASKAATSGLGLRDEKPWLDQVMKMADPSVQKLVGQYKKLQNQLRKIVSISDHYQAELQDAALSLEKMARVDYLTNLSNRRDMVDRLEVELARSMRHGTPLSLILFDIDRFKAVNDQHGHEQGDHALTAVAAALKARVRRTDVCARWGGEEFLILCPNTKREEALVVAEKCRQGVEELVIGPPHDPIKVTISGGVGSAEQVPDDWNNLVAMADEALYRAKEGGRNRVL